MPKPPPNILVRNNSFKVPKISFTPVLPKEKLPPRIKSTPSIRKLRIGIIKIIATKKEAISNGLNFLMILSICKVKIFKKKVNEFVYKFYLELNLQDSS